jgi:hypothetical protein
MIEVPAIPAAELREVFDRLNDLSSEKARKADEYGGIYGERERVKAIAYGTAAEMVGRLLAGPFS